MSKTQAPKRDKKSEIVLVTGATSGIGRLLIEKLLAKRYEVRVILREYPKEHAEWKELPRGVKVYVADIKSNDDKDRRVLLDSCRGVSTIFHLAAVTRHYHSRYTGERVETNLIINTNVIGTENMLQAFADANPKRELRFIYASSTAVYGQKREGTITEDSQPQPRDAYGESKYMAEQVIKAFATANKMISYTILRIGVVYGMGFQNSFMKIFKLLKEKRLRYVGSGDNKLALINVEDVVGAMLIASQSQKSKNKLYNLTDGVAYSQKELFKKAASLLGVSAPSKSVHPIIARIAARTRGISGEELSFLTSDRVISIEKIKREIGFKPSVNIDAGAKQLVREFLKQEKK